MRYHEKMMNIPVDTIHSGDYELRIYTEGHRDARQAAAEIAAESDALIADLLEALEEWVAAFSPVERPNTQGADLLAKSRAAIAKAKGESTQ